jgi:4-hydroxythreonine-4-phosphate dehydrogenase
MGDEEETVLRPVVSKAKSLGLDVEGPFSPDTIYMRARHLRLAHARQTGQGTQEPLAPFDLVIAMYHDQGLIPVKYLGLDEGVNVTLGLPMVRTSPDHGTAFDIAGTGLADAASFLQAYQEAQKMALASEGKGKT